MTLAEIKDIVKAEVYVGHHRLGMDVKTAFSADLMSDVLAFARSDCLLITGITNAQSVRTAYALDISAILVCRGKKPMAEAIEIARELGIPLLSTKYIMFETCGRLFQKGMIGCIKETSAQETSPVSSVQEYNDSFFLQGRNFPEAGMVSSEIKKSLRAKGVPEDCVRRVAVVVFEAEVNIISYALEGTIDYIIAPDAITIHAIDRGPGIPDIELAMQEGYSTADDTIRALGFGAGMGLANMKKFSDVFDLSSEVGKGTYLKSTIRITPSSKGRKN